MSLIPLALTSASTAQLRLGYDATHYADFTADASGNLSISTIGDRVILDSGKLLVTDGTALDASYDLSDAAILGLDIRLGSTHATDHYIGGHVMLSQTVATTGSAQGFEAFVYAKHTSGTVGAIYGLVGNLLVNAPGGTVTNAYAHAGGLVLAAGTVTNAYGFRTTGATVIGGTLTNNYGLYITALSGGANNWAIWCDGGNVTFRSSALATGATTGHLFIPSSAGAPTGVPASIPTGQVAFQYDATNNKLYVYNGGWKATAVLT